jgi:hypothetical protein
VTATVVSMVPGAPDPLARNVSECGAAMSANDTSPV